MLEVLWLSGLRVGRTYLLEGPRGSRVAEIVVAVFSFDAGGLSHRKAFVYNVTSYTLSNMASIRVSDDLYRELNRVAGRLRTEVGHPVSMEEVLEHLLKSHRLKPSDFQGAWTMSDEEAAEFKETLKRFWSSWKYPRE